MKTLKEICEGFFNNVGSMSPSLWLSKLKCIKSDNEFWGDLWSKEYLYKIDGSKLILIHDNNKCVFDFAKGLLWTSLVKFCDLMDEYVFTFKPAHGQICFKLWSKKRLGKGPVIFINFYKNMNVSEIKITNKEILGIDDKLYKSKGYTTTGYIFNKELIKSFIEYESA